MSLQKSLLLLLCVLTITSCFKEEDEIKIYADINGVVNNGATPVEGAEIHIKSHFKPGGFTQGTDYGEGIPLQLSVPVEGRYTVELFRLGDEEPFIDILDDTLEIGQHTVLIPDSILSNGIYLYDVQTPAQQVFKNNFLINRLDSTLSATLPYTTTNATGEFTINAEYLAIGETFSRRQGNSFTISDSLQIIVVVGDSIVARNYLEVDEEVNFVEINLE